MLVSVIRSRRFPVPRRRLPSPSPCSPPPAAHTAFPAANGDIAYARAVPERGAEGVQPRHQQARNVEYSNGRNGADGSPRTRRTALGRVHQPPERYVDANRPRSTSVTPDGRGDPGRPHGRRHGQRPLDPSWSPDGTKVVFSGARSSVVDDLYVISGPMGPGRPQRLAMNADAETVRRSSPDGATIVFQTPRNSNADLSVIDADSTDQRRCSPRHAPTGITNMDPSLGPAARRILFSRPDGPTEMLEGQRRRRRHRAAHREHFDGGRTSMVARRRADRLRPRRRAVVDACRRRSQEALLSSDVVICRAASTGSPSRQRPNPEPSPEPTATATASPTAAPDPGKERNRRPGQRASAARWAPAPCGRAAGRRRRRARSPAHALSATSRRSRRASRAKGKANIATGRGPRERPRHRAVRGAEDRDRPGRTKGSTSSSRPVRVLAGTEVPLPRGPGSSWDLSRRGVEIPVDRDG